SQPMSPILKAILSVFFLFGGLAGAGWLLLTQYPEVFEQILQKIAGLETKTHPLEDEMATLLNDIQNSQIEPSVALLKRLLDDSQNFLQRIQRETTKHPELESKITSIINDLSAHLQLLNQQKNNLENANKFFKEDYSKAESLYLLVTKEIRGDPIAKEEARKKLEQIKNFDTGAESACKDIQKAVQEKNLPIAWIAAESLLKNTDLHPTKAFKAQQFPFLVMIYPPLPVSYKDQKLSEYPAIVYEKMDAFDDNELKSKQANLFDIAPIDPKKRLNLEMALFKDFNINNLMLPWIKIYQAQHKIVWKLSLEKSGKVLYLPIEREGDMIFSINRTVYRISGSGKLLKQCQMEDALAEVSGQILDMGEQLVVPMQNGKIYLLDPDSLQILATNTEMIKTKNVPGKPSTPVRINKNSFAVGFQGMVYRFKIEDKNKLSLLWKWQLSNFSDGQLCYREKVSDKEEDAIYIGGAEGHIYEVPVNKKINQKMKPWYTLENPDEITEAPLLLPRQQFLIYSKTGHIVLLNSEKKPTSQLVLPGKPLITRFVQEEKSASFYFGGSNGMFYRLQPQERGDILKEISLTEGAVSCPPCFLNEKIYVGMTAPNQARGAIHCLSEEEGKFQIVWTHILPDAVSYVWLYQNMVLVSLRNGEILAFPE
ncbi:MAG: hypothetical protein AABZ60_17400, partial [Planctomycetota bacterium]